MRIGRANVGQAYIAPTMILLGLVLIAPTIYGFVYSLYNIKFLKPTAFVDFANYSYLFTDPDFLPLIGRSFVFAIFAISIAIAIALPVAVWIDGLRGPFALVMQIVVILPWAVSSLISSFLFRWVYVSDIGWATKLFDAIGISNFLPLSNPVSAMIVLIVYAVWRTLGFSMLLLLGGLKGISHEVHEAAHVDGATGLQRFFYVTLPMLRTQMLIAIVILTVSNLNNVEGPLIVTNGGPANATDVVPLDIYNRAFGLFDFNSAIPLGIGMFVANIVLAIAYVRLVKRDV